MADNLQYRVSAREIVDLVSAMRSRRLTRSPFFQRNLVWRETHKREFIETILAGLPFPQVFLARGKINVETMEAYSCVVDGQQRLTAIEEYVDNKFPAGGRFYRELSPEQKEEFLKYKVAVIDFDLEESDLRLRDIFKRLNRTYYSLSTVEKIASEFSGSEFMVAARVLCGDFSPPSQTSEDRDALEEEDNPFLVDPSLPEGSLEWARAASAPNFVRLIRDGEIFSNYEAARQVPLMFVLTIMSTIVFGSYFNRTDKVKEYLEVYNDSFPMRDDVIASIESVGRFVLAAGIQADSFWFRKANFFTLAVEVAQRGVEFTDDIGARLRTFASNTPDRYLLAQREAVNSKRERVLRGSYFEEYVLLGDDQVLTEGLWLDRMLDQLSRDPETAEPTSTPQE